MRKNFILLTTIILTCSGAASLDTSKISPSERKAEHYFNKLFRVRSGMSRQQVKGILGEKLTIGHALSDSNSDQYEPILIGNPYKSEEISQGSKRYIVDYYYISVKKADGIVSEEELVPLVYENNKLVGQGRDFLFRIKNK